MRAILGLLLIVAIVVLGLVMTNVIDIRQTEEGSLPEFDVDTNDVEIGTETREVEVPVIETRDESDVEDARETAR